MTATGAWRRALLASASLGFGLPLTAGATAPEAAPRFFERVATLPAFLNLPEGMDPATETAAEIVAASADGRTLIYTDSPGEAVGFVDITDPAAPAPAGRLTLDGEPTSVTVVGDTVLIAVNTSESLTRPGGHVAVVGLDDRTVAARCDVGGQPDSVAASPDGRYLAVVVENERDEEVDEGRIPQLPSGHLAILALDAQGRPTDCDAARIVALTGLAELAPDDAEPEFVDVNADGVAVVTLQENNAIVLVDLATGTVTAHVDAGAVDLDGIDAEEDGVIAPTGSLRGVLREPDAVGWLDADRFVTANEGDYQGGSRGFTVFDRTGRVLFDAGNAVERLAVRAGHFPEARADAKGVEIEGLEVGRYGDQTLIFAGAERGNFVAVYEDRGADAAPAFVQLLPTGVGPEGLLAIPQRDLFVVASETDSADDNVRANLSIYARTADAPAYPSIEAGDDPATGAPIGWGALSALAADPADPDRLYAVSDSYYRTARIFTIDVGQTPARITGFVELTRDGAPVEGYDLEGIAVRPGGGFWLVSEGAPDDGRANLLIAVAQDGTVEQEIALPEDLAAQAKNNGYEGVASWTPEGGKERVVLAVQREWKDDPKGQVKLAVYAPDTGGWSFVRTALDAPSSAHGGWVGLSEITSLGGGRFALIERDNQPGVYAAHKAITTVSLAGVEPQAYGADLPLVEKTTAIDLLPAMRASAGWIPDKVEGFAVTADGRVFAVTDNDGVEDATGETQLLNLGTAAELLQNP